jgi:hypothetical protein
MHFMDPKALAGLNVFGSTDVKLFRYYGISYGAAGPSASKPVPRARATSSRTMLHRYATPTVNRAG